MVDVSVLISVSALSAGVVVGVVIAGSAVFAVIAVYAVSDVCLMCLLLALCLL